MMTRDEFIAGRKAYKREENCQGIVWVIVFFGVLLGNIPLLDYFAKLNLASILGILYGVAVFGFFIGNYFFLIWVMKRRVKKHGLQCPSCGQPLIADISSQIAMATGHCGHCGAQVFQERFHDGEAP